MSQADVDILTRPEQAAAVLHPDRRRILELLGEPGSATTLGDRMGLPRQRVNYHLRELERVGLVELVEERRKRNCVERVLRATAHRYVISPEALDDLGRAEIEVSDRFSSAYLAALAARILRELGVLRRRAQETGTRLATLALHTDLSFASAADRAAFADGLTTAVAELVRRHHRPDARGSRRFRLTVGLHPALDDDRPAERTDGGPDVR